MAKLLIREYRLAASLSLEQLAEDVGVSTSQMSRIERGERDPRLSEIQKISQILGVSIDYLIREKPAGFLPKLTDTIPSSLVMSAFELLFREFLKKDRAPSSEIEAGPPVLAKALLETLNELPVPPAGVTIDQLARVEVARLFRQLSARDGK
jgi:transcriptional regulator with XRE-family HTH domain